MTTPPAEPARPAAPRWLPVLVLVAATLAVDAAVVVSVPRVDARSGGKASLRRGPLNEVVLLALASSQVGLLAVWAGLGRGSSPGRFAAVAAAVVGWSLLLARQGAAAVSPVPWMVQAGFVCVVLRFRWSLPGAASAPAQAAPREHSSSLRRGQFTLGSLMGWVTNLTIGLSVIRWAVQVHAGLPDDASRHEVVMVGLGDGVIALSMLWAVAGNGRAPGRIAACGLLCVLGFLLDLSALRGAPWDALALYVGLQAGLVAGSLVAVRAAGHRILAPGPGGAQTSGPA